MPLGEIAGEALGGVIRFVGRMLFELVFELLIQGSGHVVLKTIRPRREPSEVGSTVVGLLVWAAVVGGGIWFYQHAAA